MEKQEFLCTLVQTTKWWLKMLNQLYRALNSIYVEIDVEGDKNKKSLCHLTDLHPSQDIDLANISIDGVRCTKENTSIKEVHVLKYPILCSKRTRLSA